MLSAAQVPANRDQRIPKMYPPGHAASRRSLRGILLGVVLHSTNNRSLGRTPCRGMGKREILGMVRLALALPLCGIVRASLTMTG